MVMEKSLKSNYPLNEDIKPFADFKEALSESVTKCNGKPAFEFKEGKEVVKISYEQFYNDTKALGSALADLGFADKHVALIGPNSYKWVTVYLTMMNAEGVFVPIDKELPFDEIMRIVNDSDSEVFLYADFYEKDIMAHRAEMPNIKYFIGLDRKEDEGEYLAYDSFIEKGRMLLEEGYTVYTDMKPKNEEMKTIVYTSGTTGTSKGVMLSHKNLISLVYHGRRVSNIYDRCLSVLPYHHTYAAVCELLVALRDGATICINENLRTVAGNFKLYKPDFVMLVPLYVETFYKKIWANAEDTGKAEILKKLIKVSNALLKVGIDMRPVFFKSIREVFGGNLKKIVCGGAPMRKELGEFFESVGILLMNGYGITECSPLVSGNRDRYYNYTSVGVPLACLEVKIENPNEAGEGEICVKGDTVMMGYYKRPDLTADVLEENGWFHTGDYGKLGDDGRLYITGRKKNMIVLKNGKNIYPEEIEDNLQNHLEIEEVIVSAIKDEDGAETGLAAEIYPNAALREKYEGKPEELLAAVKALVEESNERFPVYKKVTKVIIRETPFEKTTSRKIKRKY